VAGSRLKLPAYFPLDQIQEDSVLTKVQTIALTGSGS